VTSLASGLYLGAVTHARLKPRVHRMRYRVFMLLLDLDELDRLDGGLRLFAHGRFALTSFHQSDHLDGSARPLKEQVEAHLAAACIAHGGPIRMLCMPRILGAVFNPLTVYFCHRLDGALSAILYEVSNTFGDRHSYLIPVEGRGPVAQACDKSFYVSPFMEMDLTYAFRIQQPEDSVSIVVDVHDVQGQVMGASFSGRRRELTDASLFHAWLTHPLMTLGIMAAIHWEALKIWRNGGRLRPRPAPPAIPVTVVHGVRAKAA
jgi:DUF1365 family protein